MLYPMKLIPAVKDYVWGGSRLKSEWGKISDSETIAESWELSCHNDGAAVIADGEYSGRTLKSVLEQNPALKGKKCDLFEFFPILIKLIDAKSDLSIQVHPDDVYALEKEGQYGKTEMWYIVDCDEGSGVYCGFKKPVSKAELECALRSGNITDYLNFIQVKKGDCIFIPSGTVHAICGGLLICEVQQNSSLTYRLYDYDRKDKNGNKRPLHIEKALDVVDTGKVCKLNESVKQLSDNVRQLADCRYFTTYEIKVRSEYNGNADSGCFISLTCVEGCGCIEHSGKSYAVSRGDTYFLPAGLGNFTLKGNMTVISATV